MDNGEKIKILFIDDEENNLHAFKAAFRRDYEIHTAQSADQAEAWLENNEVEVIMCDQRMPGRTGVDFFASVINKHPRPIRMLVTGYTDIESVIKAINMGQVYRYINKPWNEAEIRSAVEGAHRYYMQGVELEKKVQELTVAYQELDNFAYSVSHDLKGPLMSIMGAMNIVTSASDKNDKNVGLMLDLVERTSVNLNEFIDNMHDYYKNKRGVQRLENINLEEIREEMQSFFGLKCLNDGIRLTFSISSNKAYFNTDKVKVKMILNNLISNALKYQRPDEPDKRVNVDMNIDGNLLTIIVSDNGMGIGEQFQANIFELFFRATNEVSGSGFGLYNVRETVALLGGTINVESKLNFGSTFTVKLPAK